MSDICSLQDTLDVTSFGGKAANLSKMMRDGLPVPKGFAASLDAFDDEGNLTQTAITAIEQKLDASKLYAVRSSELAEDAEDASWAGQFESFLNTKPEDVIVKVVECHNSAKARARAYASKQGVPTSFNVAVVIQEMLQPEYAGVLFTKDPVTGSENYVTEYIEGLGEELVSGRADPKRIVLDATATAPFDVGQLVDLASSVERLFGVPQDIEWVWAEGKTWFVQTRPITAIQKKRISYDIGLPDDLFYWGPSRAKPMYMSDFMKAVERFLTWAKDEPDMPNPPKTLVLFSEGKMVWLNNAQAFSDFVEKTFDAYEIKSVLSQDVSEWRVFADNPLEETLVDAWYKTEFAEFALYGAESALTKRLSRFDEPTRQEIWGAFTVPDNATFLSRMDNELAENKDPDVMAQKYPWIEDGYDGSATTAKSYFGKRLQIVHNISSVHTDYAQKREELAKRLQLTNHELSALNLARELAEFMDDRKAWMMQTRRLITQHHGTIEHGWLFSDGETELIDEDATRELWERYIDFKSSSNAVSGIVASNGGKHFVNGEVVVVNGPTDTVEDGRIVVVPFTSPSYVPLMRKAKALITDHGGMMSHAAIVAREFNLPCIVGTKQATKVLETGDKVVLDLLKGEVNK